MIQINYIVFEKNMLKLCIILGLMVFIAPSPTSASIPRLDGRIVGGKDTNITSHPYQISLELNSSHVCGGSIIGNNTVLTAAHCVFQKPSPSLYTVLCNTSIYGEGGKRHSVTSIRIHNKFNHNIIDYDVAVLTVSPNFTLGPSTAIVKLKNQGESVQTGTMCNVTGWGAKNENGLSSKMLQVVTVPIVSEEICRRTYGQLITDRMICAGVLEGGKDSCQGDSGGPLVAGETQIGIVSWGDGCARPNTPGVYTKVSSVRDWIVNAATRSSQINGFIIVLSLISYILWK